MYIDVYRYVICIYIKWLFFFGRWYSFEGSLDIFLSSPGGVAAGVWRQEDVFVQDADQDVTRGKAGGELQLDTAAGFSSLKNEVLSHQKSFPK